VFCCSLTVNYFHLTLRSINEKLGEYAKLYQEGEVINPAVAILIGITTQGQRVCNEISDCMWNNFILGKLISRRGLC
jgi:hypothetical protein